jgi:tripartite-type tricarboxylate transporter receptor subunit TctC
MLRRRFLGALLGSSLSALPQWLAAAPGWPSQPVKLVVPFAAGGSTDIIGRVFAQGMSAGLGQNVIVDNRAGAGGAIGAEAVARAAPDGYTIFLGTIGTHGINTSLQANLPYHPERDFEPIALLGVLPNILVVPASLPATDLKQFLALAKSRTQKLTYASTGNGTGSHLATEYFRSIAGIDAVHVPYKGSTPALSDLIAGRVDFSFDYVPSALPHVRSGKLRALALTGERRSPAAPDVPTLMEQGLNMNVLTWYALYAPKGTPAAIVARLQEAAAEAGKKSEVASRLEQLGVEVSVGTPQQLAAFQKAEITRWSKVIKDANIKPE